MAKFIFNRQKCIGCGICQELQPDFWRMSKKDGKAVLLNATSKKDLFLLPIHSSQLAQSQKTAEACAAKSIQLV